MPSLHSLLWCIFLFGAASAQRKCYAIDGTQLNSSYAPCPNGNSTQHVGCCATNMRSPGSPDLCLSTGLCLATDNESIGMIWQRGCTDPTFQDPSCPKLCPDVPATSNITAWNVQSCSPGTYCCRPANDSTSCCADPAAPSLTTSFLGSIQLPTPSPSSSSAPSSSSPTSSPTTTPTAAPNSTPTASPLPLPPSCAAEKHRTAVVGGTLGGLFGSIILGLLGLAVHLYQREKRQRRLKEHYESQYASTWAAYSAGLTGARPATGGAVSDAETRVGEEDKDVEFIGKDRE